MNKALKKKLHLFSKTLLRPSDIGLGRQAFTEAPVKALAKRGPCMAKVLAKAQDPHQDLWPRPSPEPEPGRSPGNWLRQWPGALAKAKAWPRCWPGPGPRHWL